MKRSFATILSAKLNSGWRSYLYRIPFCRVYTAVTMTADNISSAPIRKQQFIFCERVATAYFAAELEESICILNFGEEVAAWIGDGFIMHPDTTECLKKASRNMI